MKLDIITIFPAILKGPLNESIMKRAQDQGFVEINYIDLRDFTTDRHRSVDDKPYGGGAGMLMKPEPLFKAIESLKTTNSHVIMPCPTGQPFKQNRAKELAQMDHIIFVCGHYEGIDERVHEALIDEEISLGDFVLTNGSLSTAVICDAIVRLIPGVLGCDDSSVDESFSEQRLEYPQYTRPEDFRGMKVPNVLLSGNHKAIAEWRMKASLERTRKRRPDLLK